MLFVVITLSGCGNNTARQDTSIPVITPNIHEDKGYTSNDIHSSSEYAEDNIKVDEYLYSSGIYIEDAEVAQEYDYGIRVIGKNNSEDIPTEQNTGDEARQETEEGTEEGSEDENTEEEIPEEVEELTPQNIVNLEYDINGISIDEMKGYIEMIDIRVEELNSQLELYIGPDGEYIVEHTDIDETEELSDEANEESDKSDLTLDDIKVIVKDIVNEIDRLLEMRSEFEEKIAELTERLNKIAEEEIERNRMNVVYWLQDIYDKGIYKIYGYLSVESYNKDNKTSVSMIGVVRRISADLELIDYYEAYIDATFAEDEDIISSWIKIKDYLINWQNNLCSIETAEEYINANYRLGETEREDIYAFIALLSNYGGGAE